MHFESLEEEFLEGHFNIGQKFYSEENSTNQELKQTNSNFEDIPFYSESFKIKISKEDQSLQNFQKSLCIVDFFTGSSF
jgi:hypothetical protein